MAKNPADVAQRWVTGMQNSGDAWKQGVQAVTVAPGQAAARKADLWLARLNASKGKWQANVASVSLQEWQTAMIDKGQQRIGTGATAAQSKFADFMAFLLPNIDRIKGTLPERGTYEQNKQRMMAFSDGMHGLVYKK
jgi:hypothetical protein